MSDGLRLGALDRLLIERWGYTAVGLGAKAKLLVNVSLRLPLKYAARDIYAGWDVFRWPLPVTGSTFVSADGVLIRGYDWGIYAAVSLRHEWYYHRLLNGLLDGGSVFIDVGAHLGGFTIRAARRCRLVIALEPDPRNYRYLVENIRLNNLTNVVALPIAAYSEACTLTLWLGRRSGESSLLADWDVTDAAVKVPARRLDDAVEMVGVDRVDLVKVDVEGAEHHVLEGAVNVLRKYRPILLLEIHGRGQWERASKLLSALGYRLCVVGASHRYPKHTVAYWRNDARAEEAVRKCVPGVIRR